MREEVAHVGAPIVAVLARSWARALRPLQALRVLLPSWRFFDSAAPTPRLLVRAAPAGEPLGPYVDALPPLPRPWAALVLDARGNLRLAYHGLLERLVSDAAELEAGDERVRELVSYELVTRLARASIGEGAGVERFQFKVQHAAGAAEAAEDVLTSAVHTL